MDEKITREQNQNEYIAADMKSFYASVECVARGLDPLKANLLVADTSRSDKTIVLAVSPALKAVGVPSRPRLFEAKRAIRDAERRLHHGIRYIIAPPRMAEYIKVSSKIYSVCLKYVAPEDIHPYSIDESFFDATPYLHFYKKDGNHSPAHTMAMTIIRDVLATTGITATVGIGTNLYLAKIAMDILAKKAPADKDGVRIARLDEESYKKKLWRHEPITDFWQVAGGTRRRLLRYGMKTMGDVARMSVIDEDLLYRLFGINAELLIDHAWGIEPVTMQDIKNYRPDAHSLSTGQVLPRPYAFDEARVVFMEMIDQLVYDMVKKEIVSSHFSYWIAFDPVSLEHGLYDSPVNIDYYGRPVPKHVTGTVRMRNRTQSTELVTSALLASFDQKVGRDLFIRRLGISANDIVPDDGFYQLDLFTDYAALERERRVQRAMFDIRRKYGTNAILKGFNYLDCGTARERNGMIGGHHA